MPIREIAGTILDTITEGFVLHNKEGAIIHFNASAARILGISEDQLLGRTSMDPRWKATRLDGGPFPGNEHPAMVALATGAPQRNVTMGLELPSGEKRWILINAVPLFESDKEKAAKVVCTFADITQQVLTHREIQTLHDRLSIAIRAVRFGVWDWNLKQGTLIWDDFMYELFEVDKEDFTGAYDAFEKTLLPEDAAQVNEQLKSTFEKRALEFRSEFRVKTKGGRIKTISAAATCFYDSNGAIDRLVGVNWDLTEQKLYEQQLVTQSKMASLGEMAGGIAHEINNPLAIIQGKTVQLRRLYEKSELNPEFLLESLDKISLTTERIAKIIRGLRTFSRNAENDPFVDFEIDAAIEETLNLCKERFQNNSVRIEVGSLPHAIVHGRETQISQVLLNLLNNAFDAIERLPDKWVKIEVLDTPGEFYEIFITDSGPGIPPEIATKVMQPFYTTKAPGKGTGLGLSISKGIIENHGGQLRIDSKSAHTRFVIELPKIKSRPQHRAAQ